MNNLQELLSVYQEEEKLVYIFLSNGVKLKGVISEFGACPIFGGYILFKFLADGVPQAVMANQISSILPVVEGLPKI